MIGFHDKLIAAGFAAIASGSVAEVTVPEKPFWVDLLVPIGGWVALGGMMYWAAQTAFPRIVSLANALIDSIEGLRLTFREEAKESREHYIKQLDIIEERHHQTVSMLTARCANKCSDPQQPKAKRKSRKSDKPTQP